MSGSRAGGLKAVATNKARHGEKFYAKIGKKGGKKGHTGGFAANPELARKVGAIGGRKSKRAGGVQDLLEKEHDMIVRMIDTGESLHGIATKFGCSDYAIKRYVKTKGIIGAEYTPLKKYTKKSIKRY